MGFSYFQLPMTVYTVLFTPSILALLLMLPMLSFGQPVQLTVFYKQKAVVHETQRASSVT
jgi:hypothetical protein